MIIALFLAAVQTPMADPVYAKPDMLTDAAEIVKVPAKFHLVDCRPAKERVAGWIPLSIGADIATWSKAVSEDKADEGYWRIQLQIVDVTPDKPTVVYGSDLREVCRAWWILKYAGVKDVRVLNGGVAGYVLAGGKMTTSPTPVKVVRYDWKPDLSRKADKNAVLENTRLKTDQMIDARSDGEFTGARVMAKRGGHVPGANHVEWTEFVDEKTGRFKSPAELKKLIESRKISLDQPCITYCQSGGRASVVAFGLELMGSKPVKNYYRSWSEWGNDAATPVEKK